MYCFFVLWVGGVA